MPKFRDALAFKTSDSDLTVLTTDFLLQNLTIGSGLLETVATATTTASLANYGVSFVSATTGADNVYTLSAPDAGVRKTLYCTAASSSDTVTVFATTLVSIGEITSTAAYRNVIFGSPGIVELVGLTTARWAVTSIGTTLTGTTSLPTFTT